MMPPPVGPLNLHGDVLAVSPHPLLPPTFWRWPALLLVLVIPGLAWGASAAPERLNLQITPPHPVLGVDHEVMIKLALPGGRAPGASTALRVLTNVGAVEDVSTEATGYLTARLVLPERRFPQGLILVVQTEAADGRRTGVAFVALPAVAAPAFQTDPEAQVSVVVGERSFGPKNAERTGEVRVPVIVPPGQDVALVQSRNRFGKTTERRVPMGLPAFERVLIVAPESQQLGQPFEAFVFHMDPQAGPGVPGSVSLFANGRPTQPLQTELGWTRFLVRPPARAQAEERRVMLAAYTQLPNAPFQKHVPSVMSEASTGVALVPGPAARLFLRADRNKLLRGSRQRTTVSVRAEDIWGNPTSLADTRIYVDGTPQPVVVDQGHRLKLHISAPAKPRRRAPLRDVRVEAVSPRAYAQFNIGVEAAPGEQPLQPQRPIKEYIWGLSVRGLSLWNPNAGFGFGASTEVQVQPLPWLGWPRGVFLTGGFGAASKESVVSSSVGLSRLSITILPLLAGAAWRVRPVRHVAVFLGVQAGVAQVWIQNETLGVSIRGTGLAAALRWAMDVAMGLGRTQLVWGVAFSDVPGTRLSSGDRIRGNLGGWELNLGLRQVW